MDSMTTASFVLLRKNFLLALCEYCLAIPERGECWREALFPHVVLTCSAPSPQCSPEGTLAKCDPPLNVYEMVLPSPATSKSLILWFLSIVRSELNSD